MQTFYAVTRRKKNGKPQEMRILPLVYGLTDPVSVHYAVDIPDLPEPAREPRPSPEPFRGLLHGHHRPSGPRGKVATRLIRAVSWSEGALFGWTHAAKQGRWI